MHEGEYVVTQDLVHRLLVAQFPHLSDLEIRSVASAGTDNALFRLGADFLIRMPIVNWAVAGVETEQKWLPFLAPFLPVQIPTPISMGVPGQGYPCNWSVYRWCEGENPQVGKLKKPLEFGADLARFLTSLRKIDATGAPIAERGLPLAQRDEDTRIAIVSLASMMATEEILEIWQAALELPVWDGPGLWIHGDLSAGNVLTVDGRLNAVIDFGATGVGDPAVDLIIAWNLLTDQARATFRSLAGSDDATWKRGRAWALSIALIQLPYYFQTNLALAQSARYVIGEVLADYRQEQR